MKKLLFLFAIISMSLFACKDACEDVTCQNGGTCDDGTCICADGYSGTNCETAENAKFVGNYDMLCNGAISANIPGIIDTTINIVDQPATATITAGSGPTDLNLETNVTFAGQTLDVNASGSADGSTFALNDTSINILGFVTVTIGGDGSLSADGNTLTVDLDVAGTGITGDITCVGDKQ